MNNLHNGAAVYKHMSQVMVDQVAMHITQHAIRDGNGSGAGGHGGGAHNTDTHTNNNVHNEQLQAEEPGDNYSGKVQRDVCLDEAIDGHYTDEFCWRKHDACTHPPMQAPIHACTQVHLLLWMEHCLELLFAAPEDDFGHGFLFFFAPWPPYGKKKTRR